MTVHRSKGLEADYAVVLGLYSGKLGFPAEIADDPLLDLVLAAPEAHPNAEERRLLYVAVTRARRQVFLLAEGGRPSEFVTELIDGGYDVEVFGRPPESDVPCPRCGGGGRLERRENARDQSVFYGCSNFPLCEHTAAACPRCGNGLPVRSGEAYICRDCGGSIEACPVCDGWLNARMGRYGRFLGCSNFPNCNYTRNLRESKSGAERRRTARNRNRAGDADSVIVLARQNTTTGRPSWCDLADGRLWNEPVAGNGCRRFRCGRPGGAPARQPVGGRRARRPWR